MIQQSALLRKAVKQKLKLGKMSADFSKMRVNSCGSYIFLVNLRPNNIMLRLREEIY